MRSQSDLLSFSRVLTWHQAWANRGCYYYRFRFGLINPQDSACDAMSNSKTLSLNWIMIKIKQTLLFVSIQRWIINQIPNNFMKLFADLKTRPSLQSTKERGYGSTCGYSSPLFRNFRVVLLPLWWGASTSAMCGMETPSTTGNTNGWNKQRKKQTGLEKRGKLYN